jgi:signal transduction histidine kinase
MRYPACGATMGGVTMGGSDRSDSEVRVAFESAVFANRVDEALDLAAEIVARGLDGTREHGLLAIIYQRLGHAVGAEELLQRALQAAIDPEDRLWLEMCRGALLRSVGRDREAADAFATLLERREGMTLRRRVRIEVNAASAFWPVGRVDEADACIDWVLAHAEDDNDLQWAQVIRAWILVKRGRYGPALRLARGCLEGTAMMEKEPRHLSAERALAQAHRGLGQEAEAESVLRRLAAEAGLRGWRADREQVLMELIDLQAERGDLEGERETLRMLTALLTENRAADSGRLAAAERVRRAIGEREVHREQLRLRLRDLSATTASLAQRYETLRRNAEVLVHDLNNMLTAAGGVVELLPPDTPETAILGEALERMAGLLGRFDADRGLQLRIEPTDLVAVCRSVMDGLQARAEAKGIRLSLHARVDDRPVLTDPSAVARILDNLLGNALKFSTGPGEVRLQVERVGPRLRLLVMDEGPGLIDAERDLVFGRGVRGSARPTAGERSSGRGLAIVRELCEALGGHAAALPTSRGAVLEATFEAAPVLARASGS